MPEVRAVLRAYFSRYHLRAAIYFGKRSEEIEEMGKGPLQGDYSVEHRSFVIAAIMFSVAFLEASINELFRDASDHHKGSHQEHMKELQQEDIGRLAEFRSLQKKPFKGTLDKYDTALDLLGKTAFDKGIGAYQGAQCLIDLRNALVHAEPKSRPVGGTGNKKEVNHLESALRGRFKENQRTGDGNPWFPDKCLGAGCAQWTVDVSCTFSREFFKRMGLIDPNADIT